MPDPSDFELDTNQTHRFGRWNLHESIPTVPPFLLKIVDYISFPRVLGELMKMDPQFAGVNYTEDFPTVPRPEVPLISYRLIKRVPGMDKVETRKPRFRFSFKNEDGTMTEIWSQWMSCIYQFDCIASTSQEADDLVYKFDWFIRNNVGIFLSMGASEVVFEEQLEDHLLPQTQDLVVRSIRWLARLESLEYRNVQVIDQVALTVFEPQEDAYETIVRGPDTSTPDYLQQTFISNIVCVSDPSPSGIARTRDYFPNVDFITFYHPDTHKTALQWLPQGKSPSPGATYYVRYLHWTAFARLRIPYFD